MELRPNTQLKIVRFKEGAAKLCRHKLLALGLLPGTVFNVLHVAPMGGPVQLKVRSALFSLRRSELDALEVEFHGN